MVVNCGHGGSNKEGGKVARPWLTVNMVEQLKRLPKGTRLTVGKHRIVVLEYLAEGGFAHIYKVGIDPVELENVGCLKRVIIPDKFGLDQLRREVEVMKQLRNSRSIVTYYDSHAERLDSGEYQVLVLMELCPHKSLLDFMNDKIKTKLSVLEILNIMFDISIGVYEMHKLKMVHRDIKIENVLIDRNHHYKLADFGSTSAPIPPPRSQNEFQALARDIMYQTTPQYRSPEMIDLYRGIPIDEKSDIWALGCFLYKLCYYTTPFDTNGDIAILHASYQFPSHPKYPGDLQNLIIILLQENPLFRPNIVQVIELVCKLLHRDFAKIDVDDIYNAGPYNFEVLHAYQEHRRNDVLLQQQLYYQQQKQKEKPLSQQQKPEKDIVELNLPDLDGHDTLELEDLDNVEARYPSLENIDNQYPSQSAKSASDLKHFQSLVYENKEAWENNKSTVDVNAEKLADDIFGSSKSPLTALAPLTTPLVPASTQKTLQSVKSEPAFDNDNTHEPPVRLTKSNNSSRVSGFEEWPEWPEVELNAYDEKFPVAQTSHMEVPKLQMEPQYKFPEVPVINTFIEEPKDTNKSKLNPWAEYRNITNIQSLTIDDKSTASSRNPSRNPSAETNLIDLEIGLDSDSSISIPPSKSKESVVEESLIDLDQGYKPEKPHFKKLGPVVPNPDFKVQEEVIDWASDEDAEPSKMNRLSIRHSLRSRKSSDRDRDRADHAPTDKKRLSRLISN